MSNDEALEKALTALREIRLNHADSGPMRARIALDGITYTDKDGTLRNGDGSRNIFDDVDQ